MDALFTDIVRYRHPLFRNIAGLVRSENLFDDLSDDPVDWLYAQAADATLRPATVSGRLTRPFDYANFIADPFSHYGTGWRESRFADGAHYGVWYGCLEDKTTLYETVYHWLKGILAKDISPEISNREPFITERRIFAVDCDALLVDMRQKHSLYPNLIHPSSYVFTHQVGRYLKTQNMNGCLVKSARCDGINAAIFRAEVLSNPVDKYWSTYSWRPGDATVTVRKGRQILLTIPVGKTAGVEIPLPC